LTCSKGWLVWRDMGSHLSIVSLLLVTLVVRGVLAQQQGGQLGGVVVDDAGTALPGVEVRATLETGPPQTRTTISDNKGRFRFTDLPVGTYRLESSLPGFSRRTIRDVRVGPGKSADVRVEMESPDGPKTGASAGGRPTDSAPPPTRGAPPPPRETPPPEPSPGLAVVPVFFATDRARATPSDVLNFGTERNASSSLNLGRFDVSIPRDHKMGKVERPNVWTFWKEDPKSHLVITSRKQQSYEEFYQDIRSLVGKSTLKEAFVFIHGFNVEFESAIFRTAQISYDLGFDGAPILYSWPSLASLSPVGYSTDAGNADWTAPHLRWFLEDVAAKSGAQRIHLIAHSMGNKALVNALDRMPASNTRKFSQIVLTAPDIDAGTFVQLADAVKRNGQMATLYASANDAALLASKKLQTYRRAGDISEGVTIVPGIDTIDVSAIDTNLIGHFYYGDNTSVVSDIFLLLSGGLPPAKRPRLRPAGTPPNRYWRFLP
jgi:esterase/lipase superfamily enzyme